MSQWQRERYRKTVRLCMAFLLIPLIALCG